MVAARFFEERLLDQKYVAFSQESTVFDSAVEQHIKSLHIGRLVLNAIRQWQDNTELLRVTDGANQKYGSSVMGLHFEILEIDLEESQYETQCHEALWTCLSWLCI